jgi:hypothetical protein
MYKRRRIYEEPLKKYNNIKVYYTSNNTNELTPIMHFLTHGADNVYLLPGPSCDQVCNVLNDEF